MKYGIFVIVLFFAGQAYGQQTRMDVRSLQHLAQSFSNQQSIQPADQPTISNLGINYGMVTTQSDVGTDIPSITSGSTDNSCDVVVQEELVAGRMGSNENKITTLSLNLDKIKGWLVALFHKKELDNN
ncbi:MAG TPA: hypothetical protein PLJ00_00355 [Chitinophagales bacterium]|nr:hypothetical protein [Chitinophagales bacterium]HRG26307.1 hypothetical protein [Chitinophagales bacterium]HRG84236.1 hypothetical protein [Chitinophagales bacterium]HRH52488.1 hypothetical protein [Chitinophagales bacterium]